MDALICLLAGKSSRMGTPKQHVSVGGHTFLEHILRTLSRLANPPSPQIFVGSESDDLSYRAVQNHGGVWVINREPDLGPLHSIHLAAAHLPSGSGFFLWPIDHPLITVETIEHLTLAANDHPTLMIVPSIQNRRGHPSRFPHWTREILHQAPLEVGAKWVLQQFPEKIMHVVVEDEWIIRNLNTPERLQEAEGSLARRPET